MQLKQCRRRVCMMLSSSRPSGQLYIYHYRDSPELSSTFAHASRFISQRVVCLPPFGDSFTGSASNQHS
jgi:hypothetical protein